MTEYPRLNTERVKGHFDDSDGILRVTYFGVVSPDVTTSVYGWIGQLVAEAAGDISKARGSIYDFRLVTDFTNRNTSTAQRESSNLNRNIDISNHPVALIVSTMFQEQFVRVFMQLTPGDRRKRIFRSEEDAVAFIDEYHRSMGQQ